ncbi:hypothetical protein GUITHDRAFT_89434 [Guillardia theta CCMP2712]|uniref:Receptor expression-enhancing protein n=1 Tax=Guillardia theta (strain CCMP2712) TaxID=905079 RepID=L1IR55_GUITC|nr:hypothetical protein GUITHDRAFT_89434 [Guillardia theta CCMP2712]EKX38280.1 hypothetical protein GUITHDRAFT_89434 [Guillardia theta CCMP2712]|eukprot:XP_005825260.1 hypothetical protein GUITHDRAFT_89434 [Guillardia theta CCMP2712]
MIGWWLSKFLAMIFSVLYPAFESYKAIKTKSTEDDIQRQTQQWLSYWVIFGIFTMGEFFLDIVICWIPLYYEAKLIFILWLVSSYTKGALLIYNKYESSIDHVVKLVEDKLKSIQAQPKQNEQKEQKSETSDEKQD